MPLPKKAYYSLKEIAKRWDASMADIEHYAATAKLELSVWILENVSVEVGHYITDPELGQIPEPDRKFNIRRTIQGILPEELKLIFRDGKAVVDCFQPGAHEDYRIIDMEGPELNIIVSRDDLVITRAERDRFEQVHTVEPILHGETAPTGPLDKDN